MQRLLCGTVSFENCSAVLQILKHLTQQTWRSTSIQKVKYEDSWQHYAYLARSRKKSQWLPIDKQNMIHPYSRLLLVYIIRLLDYIIKGRVMTHFTTQMHLDNIKWKKSNSKNVPYYVTLFKWSFQNRQIYEIRKYHLWFSRTGQRRLWEVTANRTKCLLRLRKMMWH